MSAALPDARRHGIPRGLRRDDQCYSLYGFRPFFLGAAAASRSSRWELWIAALTTGLAVGGDYGARL